MSTSPANKKASLVLADGTVLDGLGAAPNSATFGRVVVETGIVGYQEALTHPDNAGALVLFTTPHIGNTGLNDQDAEGDRVQCAGLIMRDPARVSSNFRATRDLSEDLQGVAVISGIDTRAVARRVAAAGQMYAGIFTGESAELTNDQKVELVKNSAQKGA